MNEQVRILRLVVASPGDVQAERDVVNRVTEEINRGTAADRGLRLEVVRWETDASPGFGREGPQGHIDRILRIEECNVLIGIFWKRLGTPTKDARSGTEHELRLAYESWRKNGRPQIMVYFNQKPYAPQSEEEIAQWGQVLKFKKGFPKEGLWWSYKGTTEFESLLRAHLTNFIHEFPQRSPTALMIAPPLPANFIVRPRELAELRNSLLDTHTFAVVLTGMAGSGKTVLAQAVCRDEAVQAAFPDGIAWLTFGRSKDLFYLLREAGNAVGMPVEEVASLEAGAYQLQNYVRGRALLFVLDDVWDALQIAPFVRGNPEKWKLLLTTRNADLATLVGARIVSLDILDRETSHQLLAMYAGVEVSKMPLAADAVVEACGGLPLAIAIAGAMLRRDPSQERWDALLRRLRTADLEKISAAFPDYPHLTLMTAMQVSVDDLPAELRDRYIQMAVFPEGDFIPLQALEGVWSLDPREVSETVAEFLDRNLVIGDDKGRVALHHVLMDYVRARAENLPALHDKLLEAYQRQAPSGWPSGPDDGYFFERLPYHLAQAGRHPELRQLLLNWDWLQAKLRATDSEALAADFDLVAGDEELKLIQGACRLSAHILNGDRTQLGAQLVGRLAAFKRPGIRQLLRQAASKLDVGWLSRLRGDWTAPGGPLVRTLTGHGGAVNAVALTPDGKRAISASGDKTLKVWDLETGRTLRTLEGHSASVFGVAVTADGKRAVSASEDKTLKVWDLETGRALRTLEGHSASVSGAAVTPDGKWAVSASEGKTLKLWDLTTGAELRTLEGQSGAVLGVALTAEGLAVSASADTTLKVWDLNRSDVTQQDVLVSLVGVLSSPEALATELARVAVNDRSRLQVLESPDVLGVRELLTTWLVGQAETEATAAQETAGQSSRFEPHPLWLAWMVNVQGARLQQISQELMKPGTEPTGPQGGQA